MVVNFSNLDFKERPILILKNAGGTPLGVLGYAKNISGDLKYNETSSIEFELPAYADGDEVPFYNDIVGMRIVELMNIGQFTLLNPTEVDDGVQKVKSCKGYSLEYEFVYKKITLPNNTYKFWDFLSPEGTLLGMIMELMPSWRVGRVSDSLCNKYRTFEVANENLYNLIKGTVQQSYNCIFDFDTMTRTVHVRDVSEGAIDKPVFISLQNLAKSIEVSENTEDIVTRLDVNGAEGVTIRDVNPTGTNKIINLDHYMTTDNFSQSLIDKYYRWQDLCRNSRQSYYALSVQYAIKTTQKVTEQAKMTDLEGERTQLENAQAVAIQGIAQGLALQGDLDKANANIAVKQREIDRQQAKIESIAAEQAEVMAQLKTITERCKFESYFTNEEYIQLDRYLKDGEITDNTFVVTAVESYENAGNGNALSNEIVQFTGGTVSNVEDAAGNDIYEISGGSMKIADDMSASVISAIIDWHSDSSFVISAYLSSGTIQGNTFPSACVSITGNGVNASFGGTAVSLKVISGYRYFTLDASEYEKRSIAWELYEYGEEVLNKLSQPSYTFSVTSANFFALDDFESFKNNFELGQKVYIELGDAGVLKPIAIGVRFSYEDVPDMELQFSDSYASGDSTFRLVDLLEKSISMGKNVEMSKYIYSSFVDSGASTGLKEFMTSALDVAKNAIMSSTNQAISWDGAGLRLRKWANEAQTTYEPEQIWMNNNSIVMTSNNWATAEMAIGKFHDENLGDCWGIVAPRIVGTLLAGGTLIIESAKRDGGTAVFRVDGDGCKIFNSDLSVATDNTHIILNPSIGFAIGEYPVYSVSDSGVYTFHEDKAKFWADTNGNLHFKGTLHGVNGEFTGAVTATSLTIKQGNTSQSIGDYVDTRVDPLKESIADLVDTVDGEVSIYYQTSQPYGVSDKDIWYNTNTDVIRRYENGVWVDISDTTLGISLKGISDAQATADGKVVTFAQASAPSATAIGDLWIDTDDNNKLYRWNGSYWVEVRDKTIAEAATKATNAYQFAEQVWNGQKGIFFNSSSVKELALNTAVGLKITGTDGTYFQVKNNAMGFFKSNGAAMLYYENGNMTLNGIINATGGYIGGSSGWMISSGCMYNNNASYLGKPGGIYLGRDGISVGSAITLEPDGSFIIRGDNTSTDSSNYVFKIVPEYTSAGTVYKMHLGNIVFDDGFVIQPENGGTGGADKVSAGESIGLYRVPTASDMNSLQGVSNGDLCVVYAAGSTSATISGAVTTSTSTSPGYLGIGSYSASGHRYTDYFDITGIAYWNIANLSGESVSNSYARVGVGHTVGGAAGLYVPIRLSTSGQISSITLTFQFALRPSGCSRDLCSEWKNGIYISLYRGGSDAKIASTTYTIPSGWRNASSTIRTATITLSTSSSLSSGEYYVAFYTRSTYSLMWIKPSSIALAGTTVTTDDGLYIRSGNEWKPIGQVAAA
ncbi:MAG: hypothetical protein IJ418_16230 [Clostridia bacterium]|nr:hypothetical protein [Clostridia bacterium]